MSGPLVGGRSAQPLDLMIKQAGGDGWDGLEKLFEPHLKDAPLQPSDQVAINLAQLARHENGRAMIEWLMDITLRAPLRIQGATIQETALRASQRQGINGVGEAVLSAMAHGEKLLSKKEET